MCYKVPHRWSCGHIFAWSPIHCSAAAEQRVKPSENCGVLEPPANPQQVILEQMECPDCQLASSSDEESREREGLSTIEERTEPNSERSGSERSSLRGGGDEEVNEPQAVPAAGASASGDIRAQRAAELASLERELEELETNALEDALRESAHHHDTLHEQHLAEALKNSLDEAPDTHKQSLETYAEEMRQARDHSRKHWHEELGMGVYEDHEDAVNMARMESYRALLEGYKKLKSEAASGEVPVEKEKTAEAPAEKTLAATPPPADNATEAHPHPHPPARMRWPFQGSDKADDDDDHQDALYEGRGSENQAFPRDPAESLSDARHASRASHETEGLLPPAAATAGDVQFEHPQPRRPNKLKRILSRADRK